MTPRRRHGSWPSFGVSGEFLDFCDEQDRIESDARRKRALGDFDPYFVRRPTILNCPFFPSWRWAIYRNGGDLSSVSPSWLAMPHFWRFQTACSVAARLQETYKMADDRAHRASTEGER